MATKKAGATAKKTTRSKSQTAKTTVTTVKAVEADKKKSTDSSLFAGHRTAVAAALIGEFVGTFFLTGAFLVTKAEPLYMGFALAGLVLIIGTLSGAYFNPLLTLGAWVTRRLSHIRAISYIVVQFVAAFVAYLAINAFVTGAGAASAYSQPPEVFKFVELTSKNEWYVFFAELLGSSIFAFAVAGAVREKTDRVAKAFTVGFGLFVGALVGGFAASYVSAYVALNPAIALAASAINWGNINWGAVVAYLGAPLVGGVIGFALRDAVDTK